MSRSTQVPHKNYSVYMQVPLHDDLVAYAERNKISQGETYRRAVATLLELERRGIEVALDGVVFSADPATV